MSINLMNTKIIIIMLFASTNHPNYNITQKFVIICNNFK